MPAAVPAVFMAGAPGIGRVVGITSKERAVKTSAGFIEFPDASLPDLDYSR
jgi:hypothetical protein